MLASKTGLFARTAMKQMATRAMCAPSWTTADLCDKAQLDVSKCGMEKQIKIVDPAMNFKDYGGKIAFSGPISTIKAYESNPIVREALKEPGQGRVLVVDGGGSMRCAMFGDKIANEGLKNGWAGVIVYGCIRDSKAIKSMGFGVKAISTHPVQSHQFAVKNDSGLRDVPVVFGGVRIQPGQFVYADEDGIVVSDNRLCAEKNFGEYQG